MSSAKSKFIADLGSFLAHAESTIPDTVVMVDHYNAKILAHQAKEAQLDAELVAVRSAIAESKKDQQNARMFSATVRQTLQHVCKFAPEMQAKLHAARDTYLQRHQQQEEAQRKRQRRLDQQQQQQQQEQQQQEQQEQLASRAQPRSEWLKEDPPVEFFEVYDLRVRKDAAEIGLVLDNDKYGVRVVDMAAQLQQGAYDGYVDVSSDRVEWLTRSGALA